jgi:hypothetical protein
MVDFGGGIDPGIMHADEYAGPHRDCDTRNTHGIAPQPRAFGHRRSYACTGGAGRSSNWQLNGLGGR